MLFGMEDSPCRLSHRHYRQGLKIIYEARSFRTLCYGPIRNGFVIIWTTVRSTTFLPGIKIACLDLSKSYATKSRRNNNKGRLPIGFVGAIRESPLRDALSSTFYAFPPHSRSVRAVIFFTPSRVSTISIVFSASFFA